MAILGPNQQYRPEERVFTLTNNLSATPLQAGDLVALQRAAGGISAELEFVGVRAVVAADITEGVIAVALESIADGASGQFLVSGRVLASVDGTTDVGAGDPLTAVAATTALVQAVANSKIVGYALEARTADSAANIAVLFDGEHGFGVAQ